VKPLIVLALAMVIARESSGLNWTSQRWSGHLRPSADATEHDFGTVQGGTKLEWVFRVPNRGKLPMTIAHIRTSSSCVHVVVPNSVIQPGEAVSVAVTMDTMRFSGAKTVFIYLDAEHPFDNRRLKVSAISR
jgi:hypothetical protein